MTIWDQLGQTLNGENLLPRKKVTQMEPDYVAFKDQTAHEISKLNKENIQLKQSLGPKIS